MANLQHIDKIAKFFVHLCLHRTGNPVKDLLTKSDSLRSTAYVNFLIFTKINSALGFELREIRVRQFCLQKRILKLSLKRSFLAHC